MVVTTGDTADLAAKLLGQSLIVGYGSPHHVDGTLVDTVVDLEAEDAKA